jgi:hypothetical protein
VYTCIVQNAARCMLAKRATTRTRNALTLLRWFFGKHLDSSPLHLKLEANYMGRPKFNPHVSKLFRIHHPVLVSKRLNEWCVNHQWSSLSSSAAWSFFGLLFARGALQQLVLLVLLLLLFFLPCFFSCLSRLPLFPFSSTNQRIKHHHQNKYPRYKEREQFDFNATLYGGLTRPWVDAETAKKRRQLGKVNTAAANRRDSSSSFTSANPRASGEEAEGGVQGGDGEGSSSSLRPMIALKAFDERRINELLRLVGTSSCELFFLFLNVCLSLSFIFSIP